MDGPKCPQACIFQELSFYFVVENVNVICFLTVGYPTIPHQHIQS